MMRHDIFACDSTDLFDIWSSETSRLFFAGVNRDKSVMVGRINSRFLILVTNEAVQWSIYKHVSAGSAALIQFLSRRLSSSRENNRARLLFLC